MAHNKYNARGGYLDGHYFDSKAEIQRYLGLKTLFAAGAIQDLYVHPRYFLQEAFTYHGNIERAIHYEADFEYKENGVTVIEDVKGVQTDTFKIKRKLLLKLRPEIDFRIIKVK